MPAMTKTKDAKTKIEPLRMKPREAAKRIGAISYEAVLELCNTGVFTVFDNGKRGTLRRIQLLTEEVELYATRGAEALREFRAKKRGRK